ncbi:MAG: glycosyltransferase [Myxococcota bacterium]
MIPAACHFVWIGDNFPWLNFAAMASAVHRGGFSRVTLHHTDDLEHEPNFRALAELPRVVRHRLDPAREIDSAYGPRLVDLYRRLLAPAARSNLLRLAILVNRGGVYLDLDTVTCADLTPLRSAAFFCGNEHIAFPASLQRSPNPVAWSGAYLRSALRDVLRRSRRAVNLFRHVESWYPARANNAVLGAEARHPFLFELCERALALPGHVAMRRYALGTSLLQTALADTRRRDLVVHPPDVFYPLPPEISEHWFRADTHARLADALSARTRVVHWYASVRTRKIVPRFDASFLRDSRLLLAELLRRALPGESH